MLSPPRNRPRSQIHAAEEWFLYAPPQKGLKQWCNGYSAKELARAWFPDTDTPTFPVELRRLLDSRAETRNFILREAHAEFESAFDQYSGPTGRGTAHLDLVLVGRARGRETVIGIEAKSAENFGTSEVGKYFDKMATNKASNVPARINVLCQSLFGTTQRMEPTLRRLWYQLLTGAAGTLAEAKRRGASQAAFVVHVFESPRVLKGRSRKRNEQAFVDFVQRLCSAPSGSIDAGVLYPARSLPHPNDFIPAVPLFIGKCRRDITALLSLVSNTEGERLADVCFVGTNGALPGESRNSP